MRESRKKEKTHLPRNTYEVWLETQTPKPSEVKHKSPPADVFEEWMKRRVDSRLRPASVHGKKASTAAA